MIKDIHPQLMFTGAAKEAMQLYVKVFDGRILDEQVYPPEHPTQGGQILRAVFQLGEQRFACIDSPDVHKFTFTPSFSIFINVETEADLDRVFAALSHEGTALMPPGNYGFSEKFVWFNDRFGVSWQINFQGNTGGQ